MYIPEVAVVGPAQRIVVNKAVSLEQLLPTPQKCQVLLEIGWQHNAVSLIGRHGSLRSCQIVRCLKSTADGGEHQNKAVGIPQPLFERRPKKLLVEQENYSGIQALHRESAVDFIEQTDILVRGRRLLAAFTFADVVVFIGQPDMEIIYGGICLCIFYDKIGKRLYGISVVEAQVCVCRAAPP